MLNVEVAYCIKGERKELGECVHGFVLENDVAR